ncbi:MAG: hypothetical protein HDS44_00340 [Bacteroides sp.]|nr:hypothetical protein [Bacteroides sp.]
MVANERMFRTGTNKVDLIVDGHLQKGGWHVSPQINPDIFETTASEVIFASDKDTLVINSLKEWESFDFVMLTPEGDSAHVRVRRNAVNPFENPNPELLKIACSGNLTKEQAIFDIDALIYTLSQVHPDIFSVCRQEDLFRAVNNAKSSLPDSVSPIQLYRAAAPIVAMIGDGHTNLNLPSKQFLTAGRKRFPVYVNVLSDRSIICKSSLDSIISKGDKILSVNNISADSLINAMLPYVSGERPHFKLSRLDTRFTALFEMLFPADSYEVKYQPQGTGKILSHTFPATLWGEILKRCPSTKQKRKAENYSYTIDHQNNVAIMDFREFSDIEKMENFADSMFTDLRKHNISNLIIDIRNNGGGQSTVGDVLLRYISPEPFVQMDKALIRVTPLTAKLLGNPDVSPMFVFHEVDSTQYIQPRTPEEGHYSGNVYLLTSNKTFSSAGSFSWAFKECGMGTVIGEETGGMNVCYGDILMYRLPVSNLSTSISFKRFWELRADENDIHGTLPDVTVPSADALDRAMELIKKNARKH